jgi:hypothetical protein
LAPGAAKCAFAPLPHPQGGRAFLPLAKIPRTALISLQKAPAAAQIGGYWGRAPFINLGPEIHDFGDTMAVLDGLNRVVTVDTSIAHLAGAMGKEALVMLPYAPDWRWLLHARTARGTRA